MKTVILCTAGFLIGLSLAMLSQKPVMQTLGYEPEQLASTTEQTTSVPEQATSGSSVTENVEVAQDLNAPMVSDEADDPATTSLEDEVAVENQPTQVASDTSSLKIQNSFVNGGGDTKSSKRILNQNIRSKKLAIREPATAEAAPAEHEVASEKAPSLDVAMEKEPTESSRRVIVAKPPMKEMDKQQEDLVKAAPSKEIVVKENNRVLTGDWKVTEASYSGRVISAEKARAMSVSFVDDEILFNFGTRTERGKFSINAGNANGDANSSSIRIFSTNGKKPPINGIYFLEGETMTMIWGAPGEKQPVADDAAALSKARVLRLTPVDNSN